MVNREGQKFGFRTGATLRSRFSPRSVGSNGWGWYSESVPPKYICTKKMRLKRLRQPHDSKEGVLIKHVTNIYRYKKNEIEKMLQSGSPFHKMDKLDGLNNPTRNALEYEINYAWEVDSGVQYSLGKHKRWLLPKLIKESLRDEVFVEDDPKVVTVKRRIHVAHGKWDSKDCFEVIDGKTGKVHKPKNRTYDNINYIYNNTKDAELRYEFGFPYEQSRWPHNQQTKSKPQVFCEYDHKYGDYHYKAARNKHYKRAWLVKCGDKKRSGKTAGQKRRELLTGHDEVLKNDYHPCQLGKNVKVIDQEEFEHVRSAEVYQELSIPFELSSFFEKSDTSSTKFVAEKPAAHAVLKCSKNRATSELFKMYGKGCAIVIDSPSESTEPVNEKETADSTTFVPTQPVAVPTMLYVSEIKQKGKLLFRQDSIIPHTLKENWNELYQEGNSFPRKFVIDVTSMVCNFKNLQNTSIYVLFEPQCETVNESVKTLTSLVLDSEMETASTEMSSIAKLFVSKLESAASNYGVEDVVNMAVSCLQELQSSLDDNSNTAPSSPPVVPRKAVLPLMMLKDMFRWQFASYAVSDAMVEMKRKICQKQHAFYDLPCDDDKDVEYGILSSCGVCFEELSCGEDGKCVEFTALKECGHVFCDSCWEMHLKTQISEGSTSPCCPEYKCSAAVDDITIMALVPSMYSRYMDRRVNTLLETDPLWQWCPGDQCGKLVKAEGSSAVPVECSCGTAWCFKCQQEAHWPATCDQARKFHDLTKDYEDLIGRKDYITSVQIKRCPFCRYPIEKSFGCPHMQCMMCKNDFCWECLKPFDDSDHYECDGRENTEDVLLAVEVGSERYDKYLKIALTNRLARRRNVLRNLNKNLLELENSTTTFKFLDSFFKSGQSRKPHSTVHKLFDMYVTKGVVEQLKSVTDFKLQARFVLEGAAKFVGLSMNAKYHRRLHGDISNLQYVVEEMEELVRDRTQLCRDEIRHKLDHLMYHGKNYIFSIGTFVEKRCQ